MISLYNPEKQNKVPKEDLHVHKVYINYNLKTSGFKICRLENLHNSASSKWSKLRFCLNFD